MKSSTIITSDWHLGAKHGQPDKVYEFVKQLNCDKLILNGDIIDFAYLYTNGTKRWDKSCNAIIQKLLKYSKKGMKIVYIKGNHEIGLNHWIDTELSSNIFITDSYVIDKTLITHGDIFDSSITKYSGWLMWLGNYGYDIVLHLNDTHIYLHKFFTKYPPKQTLSWKLKRSVKGIVSYLNHYEEIACLHAKYKHHEQIVLGHSHQPGDKIIHGIRYLNCGAWSTDGDCSYVSVKDYKWKLNFF